MRLRRLSPGISLCLALTPIAALAGSPGSADRKAALPHVCQEGPSHGQACDPTLPDDCGLRAGGSAFACVPDFRGKPSLTGTLWVLVDEDVGDNLSSGLPTTTILLEIRARGRRFRIVESFQGGADGPEIGNWLPSGEDEIELLETTFVFQTPVEALEDVGEALKQVASEVFDEDFSGTLPVFFAARRLAQGPSTRDEFPGLDALGQGELFRVQIRFLDP